MYIVITRHKQTVLGPGQTVNAAGRPYVHSSRNSAERECENLARVNPQYVYIICKLENECFSENLPPPVIWKSLNQPT